MFNAIFYREHILTKAEKALPNSLWRLIIGKKGHFYFIVQAKFFKLPFS
jgi:hypothetical protein